MSTERLTLEEAAQKLITADSSLDLVSAMTFLAHFRMPIVMDGDRYTLVITRDDGDGFYWVTTLEGYRQSLYPGGPLGRYPYRNTRAAANYAADLLRRGECVVIEPHGNALTVMTYESWERAQI